MKKTISIFALTVLSIFAVGALRSLQSASGNSKYVAVYEQALATVKSKEMTPTVASKFLYLVSKGVATEGNTGGTMVIETFNPKLEPGFADWGKQTPIRTKVTKSDIDPFQLSDSEYQSVYNYKPTESDIATVKFWAAGKGTVTPAGMWNQATIKRFAKDKRLRDIMLDLNTTLYDTSIVTWDIKYTYNSPRPNQYNKSYTSVIPTPPFPGYVSGHSAFSGAAATILDKYKAGFIMVGDRIYKTPMEAASEASVSRVLGGIHVMSDCKDGLTLGILIAK